MVKKKKDGKIFTPKPIVKQMLYNELWRHHELDEHIIDNSCGDGAFLCEIVVDYCETYKQEWLRKGMNLKTILETYIHGIEIDPVEHKKCLENLDRVAEGYGVTGVKWDIQNRDALTCHDYDGKMDYVIANPPYIRTHDLECDLSGYTFTTEGMKDIYLAFYELGFRMLKDSGSMCYIAPSSWFTSLAGRKMRDYIMENKYLYSVRDFGHAQVFENATTYVAICVFRKFQNPEWQPKRVLYGKGMKTPITVSYDDMCIDGKFYFGAHEELKEMREIAEYGKDKKRTNKPYQVKNGYATLADDIFIPGDVPWNMSNECVIPVIKASTLKWTYAIYPYDSNGKLVTEDYLCTHANMEYQWLCSNREKLEGRSTNEPWYAYGRTQAINDTKRVKMAIKSIIKQASDAIPYMVPPQCGVYGGLYIVSDTTEGIERLNTEHFMNYVKMLGKYKSGGYYAFSSKELENYLNWVYAKQKASE